MKKIYIRSVFFNPLILVCTVLYWYHTAEKEINTLILLLFLPVILYLFEFKRSTKALDCKVEEVDRLGGYDLLMFVLLGRAQKKVVLVEITALILFFSVALVCLVLLLTMYFNLFLSVSILLCFSLPFVIAIVLNNTKHVFYYINTDRNN